MTLRPFASALPLVCALAAASAGLSTPALCADLTSVIVRFGAERATLAALPGDRIRVVAWNVHKGADPRLTADFARLARDADLALFQEATGNSGWTSVIAGARSDFRWSLARAWETSLGPTGVATGSGAEPTRELALRSEDVEPIASTPKTLLLSEFRLAGRAERLLVANVHAINFTGPGAFYRHIGQLAEALETHVGPILVAGDFNTWSGERYLNLRARLATLGLERVATDPPSTVLPLDHLFARGLTKETATVVEEISSSDHKPLQATLRFAP